MASNSIGDRPKVEKITVEKITIEEFEERTNRAVDMLVSELIRISKASNEPIKPLCSLASLRPDFAAFFRKLLNAQCEISAPVANTEQR
jgi:hypothetical protein